MCFFLKFNIQNSIFSVITVTDNILIAIYWLCQWRHFNFDFYSYFTLLLTSTDLRPGSVGGVPQGWTDHPSLWYPWYCIIPPWGSVVHALLLIQYQGFLRALTFFSITSSYLFYYITLFQFYFSSSPRQVIIAIAELARCASLISPETSQSSLQRFSLADSHLSTTAELGRRLLTFP